MDEFTFSNKLLLERRVATLLEREADLTERIDGFYTRKLTARVKRRINRLEDRLNTVENRRRDTEDQLAKYDELIGTPEEVTGTPDSYAFGFDYSSFTVNDDVIGFGKGSFVVTDSLTDSTYELGDALSVQAIGTAPYKSRRINFRTLSGVRDGDEVTFDFGSSNLGELAQDYDSITFKAVDGEGNTIFASEAIDVTNIV